MLKIFNMVRGSWMEKDEINSLRAIGIDGEEPE